jgi:ribosomal protein S27AE
VATVKTETLTKRYYCGKCVRMFHLKTVEWTEEKGKIPAEDWHSKATIKVCPVCGEEVWVI